MSHSYYNIWIHAVFSTKERQPLITPEVENFIYCCLYEEFKQVGCKLKIVNGLSDHVHCLFSLSAQRSVSEVIKHVKGISSHFVNQNNMIPEKFAWQKGYAAFSVSESSLPTVYHYIKNQKLKQNSSVSISLSTV